MRRRRATVATPGELQCKTGGVRRLAVANGSNIFQMLLVSKVIIALVLYIVDDCVIDRADTVGHPGREEHLHEGRAGVRAADARRRHFSAGRSLQDVDVQTNRSDISLRVLVRTRAKTVRRSSSLVSYSVTPSHGVSPPWCAAGDTMQCLSICLSHARISKTVYFRSCLL